MAPYMCRETAPHPDHPRLRVSRPDLALAPHLHQALLASYALHQPFLIWAKPDWTLEQIEQGLEESQADFHTPQGKSATSCSNQTPAR